jgi:hypothetical protein
VVVQYYNLEHLELVSRPYQNSNEARYYNHIVTSIEVAHKSYKF